MANELLDKIFDLIKDEANNSDLAQIRAQLNEYITNQFYQNTVLTQLAENCDSSTCPRCGKTHIIKYGKDKKGHQRFYCKDCKKSFSTVSGTLYAYSKKDIHVWYQYLECLLNGDTIIRCAGNVGICKQTSFIWRHKILSILADLTDEDPVLSGEVELDEKVLPATHKGVACEELPVKKRGMSDQKRNIACAIDEHGNKIIHLSVTGRITSDELIKIYGDKIPSSCSVTSDSHRSYHQLMKKLGVTWNKIPSGKKKIDGHTLERINRVHSALELFFHKFRGISDKYMRNYLGLFKFLDIHKHYYNKHVFDTLFTSIIDGMRDLTFDNFYSEKKFGTY